MTTAIMAASSKPDPDAARWLAVTRRDARADGTFVFAVRTTGVYCRPSCPVRRPNRENAEFHTTPAEAERSGFRPCKRCRPNLATPLDAEQSRVIAAACKQIANDDGAPQDIESLAAVAGMSPSHFHRTFKRHTGLTPKAYATAHRAQRLRDALPRSRAVISAMLDSGFNSVARFYDSAPAALGMSPSTFRAGGAGASIRYAIGRCTLGRILVAASDRGVCALSLGDDPDELVRDLQRRFPGAEHIARNKSFTELVRKVITFVDDPSIGWSLPLDLRGTAFQHRVWQALREIPLGTTQTYAELAARIGRPTATRAVGRACGGNPVAVIVPCHRVVGKSGSLTGYRWGVDRKAKLLNQERRRAK
jgi:AraC family transcriptional regulator of adaptative response/methylated-DNA-[protein]-cysteine methyltransferase